MVNSKDFAQRLQKIFDYYSLSATAFAEEIDFNRSTISHLLSGRNKPSLEFVMKVLQKFPEVGLDWLAFGKGSFPSSEKKENAISNNQTESEKTLDLFSERNTEKEIIQKNSFSKQIERIVIFYTDGTFNSYQS